MRNQRAPWMNLQNFLIFSRNSTPFAKPDVSLSFHKFDTAPFLTQLKLVHSLPHFKDISKIFQDLYDIQKILLFNLSYIHLGLGLLGLWALVHLVFQKDIQNLNISILKCKCAETPTELTCGFPFRAFFFFINCVFNTPTKCKYTIKYMYLLSPFLRHVSALNAPSSGTAFYYAHLQKSYQQAHLRKKNLKQLRNVLHEDFDIFSSTLKPTFFIVAV